MKYRLTPELFNNIAITLSSYRWRLLAWSGFFFALFLILSDQITQAAKVAHTQSY